MAATPATVPAFKTIGPVLIPVHNLTKGKSKDQPNNTRDENTANPIAMRRTTRSPFVITKCESALMKNPAHASGHS